MGEVKSAIGSLQWQIHGNMPKQKQSLTRQKKLPLGFLCVGFCAEVIKSLNWDAVRIRNLLGLCLDVQRNDYLSPTSQIIYNYSPIALWGAVMVLEKQYLSPVHSLFTNIQI